MKCFLHSILDIFKWFAKQASANVLLHQFHKTANSGVYFHDYIGRKTIILNFVINLSQIFMKQNDSFPKFDPSHWYSGNMLIGK